MSHTYETRELRERLKAQVKAVLAEGIDLRLRRKACGRAGDQDGANDARNEQVEEYRPRARALYLAYAFLKGRTYHQVEAKFAEDNNPYGYLGFLQEWEEDPDLVMEWIYAGDKTRFELKAEEEAEEAKAEAA